MIQLICFVCVERIVLKQVNISFCIALIMQLCAFNDNLHNNNNFILSLNKSSIIQILLYYGSESYTSNN